MSLQLCVLASGSSGNCTVVRSPAGIVLIDCGIGPRTAAARLKGTGVSIHDVSAICLTHLDRDHFNLNWINAIVSRGIRLFCHASRMDELLALARDDASRETIVPFNGHPFELLPGLLAHTISLAHDRAGSHGFVLDGHGARVGYATDLGHVPESLVEHFSNLDVLAIESNYDPQMQRDSSRPWFLKQRIMGGRGHLSNEQALDAIRRILRRCEMRGAKLPAHIVLLHRSRQCNCPDLVRTLFARDARIAPRLTLAEQYERTEWLAVRPIERFVGEQLQLTWG